MTQEVEEYIVLAIAVILSWIFSSILRYILHFSEVLAIVISCIFSIIMVTVWLWRNDLSFRTVCRRITMKWPFNNRTTSRWIPAEEKGLILGIRLGTVSINGEVAGLLQAVFEYDDGWIEVGGEYPYKTESDAIDGGVEFIKENYDLTSVGTILVEGKRR